MAQDEPKTHNKMKGLCCCSLWICPKCESKEIYNPLAKLKLQDILNNVKWDFKMDKKNVLITGIAGQDGSYLSELLLEKGHKVYGLVRRTSTPDYWRLKDVLGHKNFTLIEGDVTDLSSLISCFQKSNPDHVYNLAAMSHVGTSFTQPRYTTESVYLGCLNVLEAIRLWETESNKKIRMYQASSSEMFGSNYTIMSEDNVFAGVLDDGRSLYKNSAGQLTFSPGQELSRYQDESTPFFPCSPYGVAKLAAHQLCNVYRHSYGIDVRCGILFNHEGPRRGDGFVTKKITNYIGDLLKFQQEEYQSPDYKVGNWVPTQYPKLRLGNCEAMRDWTHAKDMVNAMYLLMSANELEVKDVVFGSGETHSVLEFVEEAFLYAGQNYKGWVDFGTKENKRPFDVEYLKARPDFAKKTLGWEPTVSFKELVKEMVDYELQKRNITRNI